MEKRVIDIPAGSIHLSVKGQGRPLLMVHGLFASSKNFDDVFERLPDGVMGIAPDLPACGASVAADNFVPGWERYGEFIIQVADELKLGEFDLLGHSMGGGISVMTAAGWPDRIRKLVLVDAVTLPYDVPLKGRLPLLKGLGELMFRMYGRGMFFDYFEKDVFFDSSKMDWEKVQGFYDTFVKNRGRALESLRATANPEPVTEAVPKISCPTLLLWGANDGLIPLSVGRGLEQMIDDARLVTLENSGHVPIEEQPDEATRAIFEFLKGEAQ